MAGGGEGREGDWDCGSCRNRNYAFRSFCNRCKQPRLLVDTKSPSNYKWLPRVGDWICPGCSNNNYASRENCKKCGLPKDETAISSIAMQGLSLPNYAHYIARVQGLLGSRTNYGIMGNSTLQQAVSPFSSWPYGGVEKYGSQSGSNWPFGGINCGGYEDNVSQFLSTPMSWRSGDWICNCGFHNYSSRSQCKKCSAPLSTGASSLPTSNVSDIFPGTKRPTSEEFLNDWDNKRLNAGDIDTHLSGSRQQLPYQGFDSFSAVGDGQFSGLYSKFLSRNPAMVSSLQMQRMQSPQQALRPALFGKGAKHWRDGDWMCANCNNHNFASRSCCNRCKIEKEANMFLVSVT